MNEPEIIINGQHLTPSEAMTVRVALEGFAVDLVANGLGSDENGKRMTAGYLDAIGRIRQAYMKNQSVADNA